MIRVLRKLEQGLSGGALATLPMTTVMAVAQDLGMLGQAPPEKITSKLLHKVHARPTGSELSLSTALMHFAFGAGSGAVYSVARPGQPSVARAAFEGALFGTAVWAASYAGWVPALGIMRAAHRDRPDRQLTMLVAHWVFGATMGAYVAYRRRRPRRGVARQAEIEP